MSAVLDSEQVAETKVVDVEEVEQIETAEETDNTSVEAETSDEMIVTIGDEESPPSEEEKGDDWIKDLRNNQRETAKENKRLKKQLEALAVTEPEVTKPDAKPTLESCDYDEAKFEQGLTNWYEQTQKYNDEQTNVKAKQKAEQDTWQGHLNNYNEEKAELKLDQDVEQVVLDELSETQQGILVQYAKKPAMMVLALGKNPRKLEELAKIKDPIEFVLALNETERTTKLTKRTPPKPETTLDVTSAKGQGGIDKTLEKLREEGDYTKILEYKRSLKSE